jgi:hypothetical protein
VCELSGTMGVALEDSLRFLAGGQSLLYSPLKHELLGGADCFQVPRHDFSAESGLILGAQAQRSIRSY